MITVTTIYSIKTSKHKLNIIHILLFLLFSAIVAPILFIPTVRGLLGKNKLIPGKTKWNRKLRLYLISAVLSLFGLVYCGLSILSILDASGVINWYPEINFFYFIFITIAFMLTSSLPFVSIAKKLYRESDILEEDNVYF